MADQSRPLKAAAFDLYFVVYKNDGTVIANPGGLAGRRVTDDDADGGATTNSPSCVDATGGVCKLTLTAAEMDSDYVAVKVTSTDAGAVPFTCVIYPAAAAEPTASDVATSVWGAGTKALTDKAGFSLAADQAVNAAKIGGTAQTGRDLGASVLVGDKTGFALTAAYDAAKNAAPESDGNLAAVKAKTDNLPSDPADASDIASAVAALPTDADVQTAAAAALTAYDPPTRAEATTDKEAVITAMPVAAPDATAVQAASAAALAAYDPPTKGEMDSGLAALHDFDPAADIVARVTLVDTTTDVTNAPSVTVDLSDVLAAIAALPDDTDVAALEALIDAVKLKTDTLGALAVTVASPVAASGTATLTSGDDYRAIHGRAIGFNIEDPTHALGLDAEGAHVYFSCSEARWESTIEESTVEGYYVAFEPRAVDTAELVKPSQGYEVEAVLADGDTVTKASGTLILRPDVNPPA